MNSTIPTHAYLVSFDNGESYEDYYREPLWLCYSREQAEAIVAEAVAWVAEQKELAPPNPYRLNNERKPSLPPMTDEELAALYEARNQYIAALKPPYGLVDLVEVVDRNSDGSLIITELPYFEHRDTPPLS